MIFSNLVLKDVTGPVSIGLSSARRRNDDAAPAAAGIVRNIVFSGLRGTVVTEPKKHDDIAFDVHVYPGERKSCIVFNGVGNNMLENISFTDVQLKFAGGGTAEEAAADVPQVAGEYFQIGTPPAYGMYARNVRGLTLEQRAFRNGHPRRAAGRGFRSCRRCRDHQPQRPRRSEGRGRRAVRRLERCPVDRSTSAHARRGVFAGRRQIERGNRRRRRQPVEGRKAHPVCQWSKRKRYSTPRLIT